MSKAHDVIEDRLCEMQREAEGQEREKTHVRVAVTISAQAQENLDGLCKELDMSRSQLGGHLLEAAIEDARWYYSNDRRQLDMWKEA